ncbi:MAG: hypothetical protein QM736_04385 [Vicinamibacterales bacterium]
MRDSVPRDLFHFLLEVVRQPLVLFEQLLAELTVSARVLLVDRRRLPFECPRRFLQLDGEAAVRIGPIVPFRFDLRFERLRFAADVGLECVEAFAHVVLQARRFLDEPFFEACEPPLEVAHLVAEEDVANLVEARRGRAARVGIDGCGGQGGVAHGKVPRLTPRVPHEHRAGEATGTALIMS